MKNACNYRHTYLFRGLEMKQEVEITRYSKSKGLQLSWENNFAIEVKNEGKEVCVIANNEGLISLAKHLLALAQNEVPLGTHIHLDQYNSLEDGSVDLVIEKRNF